MLDPVWIAVAVVVTALVVWAVVTAQRLDRLHIRVDRSRDALQAALDRRCAVYAAAFPELAGRARAVEAVALRPADFSSRLGAEESLRAEAAPLVEAAGENERREAEEADTRVMLALRFYNDAVADTRALRLSPGVRVLGLGGTAPLPTYCELRSLAP
ncbi:hypothetical protein [uncultured Corynebacterium sp.]|uniref:hypothetical protein n=1 Tax=uncultured Corynebacterium sp. TaxID=159447 RepID=UPI0025919687|nr:hypothetical protein [uncultured Corynebacterium sp.]